MKGALIKFIFLLFLFNFIYHDTMAQYSMRMLVPYRNQQTSNWCWAASMKMVMDFHNPANSPTYAQCDLAKQLIKLQNPSFDPNSIGCCSNCSGDGLSACITDLVITILYSYDGMPTPAEPDNYDLLFSLYGYSSIQTINRASEPMTWLQLKKQIKDCRPFIINFDPTPAVTGGLNANHAVVVAGFLEDTVTGKQGFLVKDPWPSCTGTAEAFFPYNVFERIDTTGVTVPEGSNYFVNTVLSIVHTIQPDTLFTNLDNCVSCPALADMYGDNSFMEEDTVQQQEIVSDDTTVITGFRNPPEDPDNLLQVLQQNADQVVGYNNFVLKDEVYKRFINQSGYHYAPVQYMNPHQLRRRTFWSCLFPPRKLSKVVSTDYTVVDVVSANVDEELVSTLQKTKNGTWALRKIATYSYLRESLDIRVENSDRTMLISNVPQLTSSGGAKSFTLIKYPPFPYEFFSFKLNDRDNTVYMAPAADYPELDLQKHVAYKESQVIRAIRGDTRAYGRLIRELFNRDILRREGPYGIASDNLDIR